MFLVGNLSFILMKTSLITWWFYANGKRFVYKIGIQLNNTPLVIDQNNFTTKNAYIAQGNWPKFALNNCFNCLFGATYIAKNSDKSKMCIAAKE